MPTIVVEGPRLSVSRKRNLARELTALVASAYDWPEENSSSFFARIPMKT